MFLAPVEAAGPGYLQLPVPGRTPPAPLAPVIPGSGPSGRDLCPPPAPGDRPPATQSPEPPPAKGRGPVQTGCDPLPLPEDSQGQALFLPPGTALKENAVVIQLSLQKQAGEGGVGLEIGQWAQYRLQIGEQLALQPPLPGPG